MGKIIGILNQKGGVGKSTIATHLALGIHTKHNHHNNDNFVCVYDADNPQYSIANLRSEETRMMKDKHDSGNLFYESKFKNDYNGLKPFSIFKGSISEALENFESLRENFEYTFVDVVGTINTEGYNQEFITNFDYIIIPMTNKYDVVRSSVDFVKNIIFPIYSSKQINGYSILFNGVKKVQANNYIEIKDTLVKSGYNVFDTIINEKEKYVTPYLHMGSGIQSTIFYKYDNALSNLTDELIKKL